MKASAPAESVFLLAALITNLSAAPHQPAPGLAPKPAPKPAAALPTNGEVTYQLPTTGPLPKTYRVTLAITDPKNPDWIVSTFTAGVPRTVTAANKGRFTETWNGLDENFMPVPPGIYGVKGIYMPAEKWRVDGEYHSVTPRFAGGASPFLPTPDEWQRPEPFGGDPVGSPLEDVAVGPNGVAVFYYRYLENGTNNPLIDLKKPVGLDQFVRAFNSGGAAGGMATTTNGETVWSFSADGGPKYVYRADQRPFGTGNGANRSQVYLPEGWVTAMANWKDAAGKPFVFVAQRGKIIPANGDYAESTTDFADKVTVHDGENGAVLATLPVARPQGLAVRGSTLYVLHAAGDGFAVSTTELTDGKGGAWKQLFAIPATIHPADLEVDSKNRLYLSDSKANKVFQLDQTGKVLVTYGKLDAQKPGTYDRETFMAPAKLATWVDAAGQDRLLVVEKDGPNRVTEWSADGKLLREFPSFQTKANDGYSFDPRNPGDVYILGQGGWLSRFKVDYAKRTWTVDAVWPNVGTDPNIPGLEKPIFIRANNRNYLACSRSYNVYRQEGDRWLLSTALRYENKNGKLAYSIWRDTNGNGRVDEAAEPSNFPGSFFTYHGQNWLEDLSFIGMNFGGTDVWRLAPEGFDVHGNPIFKTWKKLLKDTVFAARAAGTADSIHGGNELASDFSSDWMQTDGTLKDGFYVQARGGRGFDANQGAQYKISRYVPAKAGYALKWRVGRAALNGLAQPGEMYGAMRIHRPINGVLSVIDQTRMGVLLYTEDGLYVDTLFPDQRKFSSAKVGLYALPGEFFAGNIVSNPANGKIYFAGGKFTPMLFEMEGWTLTQNPVKPLTTVQPMVAISASKIASPPEIALTVRGGPGVARLARFAPALGGAAVDGSMNGWTSASPVTFQSDKDQTVEVRTLYDPGHLYLRWHARFATPFEARPLPPAERTFTHDQKADTLSFYIQGDASARPGGGKGGRPGDARFVFGLFKDGAKLRPVAVGFYPQWSGPGAQPQNYRTPVGQASFAHVGNVPGAELGYTLDEDGKGFVLAASLPRAAVPALKSDFSSDFRTLVNFEATFGGHNKFWWANSDGSASRETYDEPSEARLYPGSWAPAQFLGLVQGVTVRNWQVLGPFGGPGAEKFMWDPNGTLPDGRNAKDAVRGFYEAAKYPPDDGKVDLKAVYKGEANQGYWRPTGDVRWQAKTIAELDTRVVLGGGAQVWFGATWIYAPEATPLDFELQGHLQTNLRWALNGEPVATGKYEEKPDLARATTTVPLTLRAGWNQIYFRGYCVGYSPFRAGLVLKGTPEKLWKLKLSGTPPEK